MKPALPHSNQISSLRTDRKLGAHFFFNDTANTEIYTLSLHDALPISLRETNYANLDFCKMKPALPHSNQISSLRTERKLDRQNYLKGQGEDMGAGGIVKNNPQSPLRETNYANLDFCKMKPALPHSNQISSLRTERKLGAQD